MGKLVHISSKERPPREPAGSNGPAEVLVFTGVRYQRDGAPNPSRPAGTPNPNKRRRG